VDTIVLRACAVDPAERFDGAAEMGAALRRSATDLPVAAPLEELLDEVTGEIRLGDIEPTDFAPRSERRIPMRRSRIMVLAVLVALIALGGARGIAALLAPQQIDVPELVGLTRGEARSVTEDEGLEMEIARQIHDFGSKPGVVLSQAPASGTVTEGGTIEVVVSLGPHPVNVPTLTGLPLDVATVRLRASQLVVGDKTLRFSIEPEGTVIDQDPAEGRLDWGSEVDLVVSRGPRSIGVPDVTGMTVAKARAQLEAAGFEVKVVDVFSNDMKAGRVVETVPGAGLQAPEGSTIEIRKSIGPEFKELVLPDVRGMTVDAARAQLEGLGLRVYVQEVNPGCAQGGTVVDTDPLPGEKVRENDRVALFC
jgi:serine/threonine-protein kinase